MKDGLARACVKRIALVCFSFDLAVTRFVLRLRGEPLFELHGACNSCGGCCETPMVRMHAAFFYLRSLRWGILTWHRVVNGLELIREDRKGRTFVFRCLHWDPETKLCDSYATRPGMCRDYPRPLLYSSMPDFLPECGFHALILNADEIRGSLDELGLPAEKRAELERRLRVREVEKP